MVAIVAKAEYEKLKHWGQSVTNAAKQNALDQARGIMLNEVAAGRFPSDPNKRELFLRNRGRESRRNFSTILPQYLRTPFRLTWYNREIVNTGKMVEAAYYAYRRMYDRAPVVSGDYRGSITIYLNDQPQHFGSLANAELDENSIIMVGPAIRYATTIERGFASRYYETRIIPGGIVRPIAKMVRDTFGAEVSCQFVYRSISGAVAQSSRKNVGIPCIMIGAPGVFTQNDHRNDARPRTRSTGGQAVG
ncbi:hypothetical protein LCM28_05595 [Salipiger pacificus]|nr:hypothetical protein [Alloyangia pacifica]